MCIIVQIIKKKKVLQFGVAKSFGLHLLRTIHSATCNSADAIDNQASPSVACANRDPPAFDLAELGVGHIDEQR